MKINYDYLMQEILNKYQKEGKKPKILLHSCCGPCSSACIERLIPYALVTVLYYNPNIEPKEEYELRKKTQIDLLKRLDIPFIDTSYDNEKYEDAVKDNRSDLEGGNRCSICFNLRMRYTAQIAKQNNFDFFATTLTVSPHKNSQIINEIGEKIEKEEKIPYLYADFKKREGYKRSIELSKEYMLYRQDYCGCIYSKKIDYEE